MNEMDEDASTRAVTSAEDNRRDGPALASGATSGEPSEACADTQCCLEDTEIRSRVAGRLRLLRTDRGLTQQNVGTGVGMARETITEIEAGRREVSVPDLIRFCVYFHVAPNAVLHEAQPEEIRFLRSTPIGRLWAQLEAADRLTLYRMTRFMLHEQSVLRKRGASPGATSGTIATLTGAGTLGL